MTETLRQNATRGFRWTAGAHGTRQAMQFLTLIALTRLLSPDDFGLMGMAIVFSGFAQLFQDMGIGSALIQRRNINTALTSTLFWTTTLVGIVLCGVLALSAPLVSLFFEEPRVTPLLQFIGLTFIVASPGVVPKALLRRDLAFDRLARIDVVAAAVGSAVAVGAALAGAGPYALAAQTMAFAGVSTAMMWPASRFRPRFVFSRSELQEVGSYSAGLLGFNVTNHFARNADTLIIGKMLGVEALGYYAVAYQLMLYPIRHVSNVINRVAYPVYARLQDDPVRMRRAFCRTSANIATITVPIMIGLAVVAEPFVLTVFGAEWSSAIMLIVLLAPVGLAQSLITTFGALYQVTGRTMLFFGWSLFVSTLCITAFLIGVQWGVNGVAAAYLCATAIIAVPSMIVAFRLIDLLMTAYLAAIWRAAACGLGMGATILAVQWMFASTWTPSAQLGVLVPLGVVVYTGLTVLLNRQRFEELMSVVAPRRAVPLT